jgi:hypothetical protein
MAGKMAVKMAGSGFLTLFFVALMMERCLTYDFSSRFCQTVVLEWFWKVYTRQ